MHFTKHDSGETTHSPEGQLRTTIEELEVGAEAFLDMNSVDADRLYRTIQYAMQHKKFFYHCDLAFAFAVCKVY